MSLSSYNRTGKVQQNSSGSVQRSGSPVVGGGYFGSKYKGALLTDDYFIESLTTTLETMTLGNYFFSFQIVGSNLKSHSPRSFHVDVVITCSAYGIRTSHAFPFYVPTNLGGFYDYNVFNEKRQGIVDQYNDLKDKYFGYK